jgi:signal transduction histidine kinase
MFGVDRRYAFATIGALILLAAFFAIAEARKAEVREAAAQIWTAMDRLTRITAIRSLLADAETGQRGYLVTGDPVYLEPFERAQAELPAALEQLHASYADPGTDGTVVADVERLQALSESKLSELDQTITAFRGNGLAAALAVVNTGVGAQTMQEIRTLVDEMRAREREIVDHATQLWDREHFINSVVLGVGTLLNMGLVILAAYLVSREMRQRSARLEVLESEVSERTRDLADLSTHLQYVSEVEKSALARELHDELGAVLVAVKMDLSQLRRYLPADDPDVDKRWSRIQASLSEGVDLKRRLVEQLRPTLLDNMGLCAALRWQLEETCERAGLACTGDFPDEEPQITSDAAIAIFRIVQEALTNVAKHSRASAAALSLRIEGDRMIVTVTDDGVGIPATLPGQTHFHGLSSMRHRVRSLDGELEFERCEGGRGTRMSLWLPLARLTRPREPVDQQAAEA